MNIRVGGEVAEVDVAVGVLAQVHAGQLLLYVVAAFEVFGKQIVPGCIVKLLVR